ncbi:dihydroorotase [Hydrogenoanaerobacterium sp.]|uniref:dihydroorotase n=1 Tax=Hydrogenoanaerobacterium sp. TaxID=2953763 RepID=UPI00289BA8EE|nr:dihydroorotase [Hydrogenoanaerobacterium sp.]
MLIQNARVIDPANGIDSVMDILIRGSKIAAVGKDLPDTGSQRIDAQGLVACPGLIDMHVHLRDPGFTYKEDIASGCAAAAAGGFTAVACMPNTNPVADSAEVLRYILEQAAKASCKVYPVAAITAGEQGRELTDFAALKAAGAVAVSDDGRPVEQDEMMEQALLQGVQNRLLVISHCEDLKMIDGGIIHKGRISEELGVKGMDRLSEDSITERECQLAEAAGGRVHIAHVSTKGSVEIIRQAKARGVHVTAETAPHYFMMTDELLRSRDANFRMNPPLREQEDVDAVLAGVRDGTLDCIITDHAPHSTKEKADFLHAPNGIVGLETSLAATLTELYHKQGMPLSEIVQCMSQSPAEILGVEGGTLSVGKPADITLFAPDELWTVDASRFKSKSRNTPFDGRTLTGRVKYTILNGEIVYQDE